MKREEIPQEFLVFHGALQQLLGGTPTKVMEKLIAKGLYIRLDEAF